MTLEPYTGAYFTLRYTDMKERTGVGLPKAFSDLETAGLLTKDTHPKMYEVRSRIISRSELEYMHREVNAETPDMWLLDAERLLVELADRYEPAFKREADAGFDPSSIEDGLTTTEYGRTQTNLVQDTPYGKLTADADYTSGQSHVSTGGTDRVRIQDGTDAGNLAQLRREWESTMNLLIRDLGQLFIHTIGLEAIL